MTRTKIVAPETHVKELDMEKSDFTVCSDCGGDVIDNVCKGCKQKFKITKEIESETPQESAPAESKEELNVEVRLIKSIEEKRLVTGIVLKPDNRDAQKHIYDDSVIEDAAHEYLFGYNTETKLGKEHKEFFGGQGLRMAESWIAPLDMELYGKFIEKGTWIITVKVEDDDLWEDVKSGKVTGFSVGGRAKMIDG